MSHYTTGEMAKQCNITVRTVQFYDTKGLLSPSDLTEGGRRLYTDDDLTKLRLICLLKALGLTLSAIAGILQSEQPAKVLGVLLDEQAKQIADEVKEKQQQLDAIKLVKASMGNSDAIPVNSISDISTLMKNKKSLRRVYATLLAVGIAVQAVKLSTIALWIWCGLWIPFAAWVPIHLLICFSLVKFYHRNVAYICPECNAIFRPPIWEFTFANHTPKTRKLTCTQCGVKGWCVETYGNNTEKELS